MKKNLEEKLEGKPDAEESVGPVILALEHTAAPTNIAKSVSTSSNILIFSAGQTAIPAQQVKKTNKWRRKSKFKFRPGKIMLQSILHTRVWGVGW